MVLATKEQLKKWLDIVAYTGPSTIPEDDHSIIYYSKYDDSFIMRQDLLHKADGVIEALVANEVTEELTCCTGFSPKNNMWYGWSHYAFFGFGIGSKVKKGDCAFKASNKEDYMQTSKDFWTDEDREDCEIINITDEGFDIQYRYSNHIPSKQLRGTVRLIHFPFPKIFGRGEWNAKILDDAKQMAFDFAEGAD
jgi:hypothetical protein